MITSSQQWELSGSTLAELRQVIAETNGLPGDSIVRVRTRFGGPNGAPIRRVHIASPADTADTSRR